MCRFLLIRSQTPFFPKSYLERFAAACADSKEYQGHGWGMVCRTLEGRLSTYKTLTPIWESTPPQLSWCTELLIHARSAFRDEDIVLENNMPFQSDQSLFAFNGELQGVRLRTPGRTGAAKIHHILDRAVADAGWTGFQKGIRLIDKGSRYIRGMNLVLLQGEDTYVATRFGEDPEYFSLHAAFEGDRFIIASEALEPGLQPLAEGTMLHLRGTHLQSGVYPQGAAAVVEEDPIHLYYQPFIA